MEQDVLSPSAETYSTNIRLSFISLPKPIAIHEYLEGPDRWKKRSPESGGRFRANVRFEFELGTGTGYVNTE